MSARSDARNQHAENLSAARRMLTTLPDLESDSCSDGGSFNPLSDSGDDDPDLAEDGPAHGSMHGKAPNRLPPSARPCRARALPRECPAAARAAADEQTALQADRAGPHRPGVPGGAGARGRDSEQLRGAGFVAEPAGERANIARPAPGVG